MRQFKCMMEIPWMVAEIFAVNIRANVRLSASINYLHCYCTPKPLIINNFILATSDFCELQQSYITSTKLFRTTLSHIPKEGSNLLCVGVQRSDDREHGHVQQGRGHRVGRAGRRVELHHLRSSGSQVGHGETEVLVDLLSGRGQAKLVHDAEGGVGVALPAVHTAGLDGHHGGALGQDLVLVGQRLGFEEVHAGHGHHTHPKTSAEVSIVIYM